MNRLLIGLFLALAAVCSHAGQASLAWNASTSSTAVGYKMHAGTASRSYSIHVDTGAALTGIIPNLTAGQKYYFAVTAYNASGAESDYSVEVPFVVAGGVVTPPAPSVPVEPASFFAEDIAGGERLTWDLSPGATKYNIYKSTVAGEKGALLGSVIAPPATDCNITPGVRYYWTATAVNASGESADSVQDYGTALAGTCSGDSFGYAPTPPVTVPIPTGIKPSGALLVVATVGAVDTASMSIDGSVAIPCTLASGIASCPYQSRFFDTAGTHVVTITSTKSGVTASAAASFDLTAMGCSTTAGVKNGVDVYVSGCKRTWTRK